MKYLLILLISCTSTSYNPDSGLDRLVTQHIINMLQKQPGLDSLIDTLSDNGITYTEYDQIRDAYFMMMLDDIKEIYEEGE